MVTCRHVAAANIYRSREEKKHCNRPLAVNLSTLCSSHVAAYVLIRVCFHFGSIIIIYFINEVHSFK